MRYDTIMIIDDDQDDREILEAAIKEVSSASKFILFNEAESAIKPLVNKTITPDVIFLDLNMPRMRGGEFLDIIREIEHLKTLPVIVYSTAPLINISKSRLRTATAILEKPENYNHLVENLTTLL